MKRVEHTFKNIRLKEPLPFAIVRLTLVLCLLTTAFYQVSQAQVKITLHAAIDSAIKNNLSIKNEKLKALYQEKLIRSSANIPQANISGDIGQINSYYTDTRFGISQSFSFPKVYSNQKAVLKEDWKTAVLGISMKESEIRKTVSQLFYTLVLLRAKEKLLLQADTNYSEFKRKADLRFANGESNVLEKVNAEVQKGEIQLQLKLLRQNIELTKLQFQLMLNSTTDFEPVSSDPKLSLNSLVDSSAIQKHPSLLICREQKVSAIKNTRLERSKLLPDLSLGYYNTSIRGTGADNIFYTPATRFSAVQVSIGAPLLFGSQRAKILASKINEIIVENNYQIQKQVLNTQLQSALKRYQSLLSTINYYESSALPNAKLITETALKQFENGEIDYLEWVILNNQAVIIQTHYVESLKDYNESVIEIQYLTSNF